jgi:hypothetical protein
VGSAQKGQSLTAMTDINATPDALRAFRDALARFRYEQRDVADRGNYEIDKTRASLADKAERWRTILEQRESDLERCQYHAAAAAEEGGYVDCSGFARAVAEAQERLENTRRWQHRVEEEAAAFRGTANRFKTLVEVDVPHADAHLLGVIEGLQAARDIQVPGT